MGFTRGENPAIRCLERKSQIGGRAEPETDLRKEPCRLVSEALGPHRDAHVLDCQYRERGGGIDEVYPGRSVGHFVWDKPSRVRISTSFRLVGSVVRAA